MGILNGNLPPSQLSAKDDGFPTETSTDQVNKMKKTKKKKLIILTKLLNQKATERAVLEKFVPYACNNVDKKDTDR
jgi:hypothetical protein